MAGGRGRHRGAGKRDPRHSGLGTPSASGAIVVTPIAASAIGATVAPTVMFGGVSITLIAASAIGATVNPTVTTELIITPLAASAIGATVNPTIVLGAMTITPIAASVIGATVNPAVTTPVDMIFVWVRVNGVDVPNSLTMVELVMGKTFDIISSIETLELDAGDYCELVFSVNNTNVKLNSIPAGDFYPASPSVLLKMEQIR